ncbi:DUF4870 domain-containing protein [Flavobacterium sp.]|jgi:uncharacterized membrane protein|uniref:DUF4870 domain-containing protein n=1 Tax=Flavobacterium sp. TaxID=239 RepID=UPI0037517506
MEEQKDGKTAAILSYIILIGPLIALSINSENKNNFASFHIRQGLGITILFVGLGLIISNFKNDMVLISMWIFVSVLSMYGMLTAAKGEMKPIPLLGNYFQKWFKNI